MASAKSYNKYDMIQYAVTYFLERRWPGVYFHVGMLRDHSRYQTVLIIRARKHGEEKGHEVRVELLENDPELRTFDLPDETIATLMLLLG